ncbi:M48 family metallopeptidase [Crocinitomix catalasitica]|uniref:M48 family metallopeptidase n=1 Tax=Crocinitomix catalasitica TaxID=184607 RepID=UPI00055FF6E5|nr:M48 family metallopeptidase [Crocinitomix catalasitica]
MNIKTITLTLGLALLLIQCGNSDKVPKGGINLFTVAQDIELGAQVAAEIDGNSAEYPILDPATNVAAYNYINAIKDKILATGKVKHKDDFAWRVRIVKNDDVLNAFCTPGGYIYFYTGIIKYLDNEAQLAGVMGHEMGHADLRHSTRQMTKQAGLDILLSALAGDSEAIKQVTAGIIGLKFSRSHETEADRISVEYLCGTPWPGSSGAGFFEKIEAEGGGGTPEFLSTHPSPSNRVENYHTWATNSGCAGNDDGKMSYDKFKRLF